MSLSLATLSAIQVAGATVFAADVALKSASKDYADRVQAAIANNPYHLGNDVLFENWKVVARLSQTLAGIEDELKKVYFIASELISDEQPLVIEVPALSAPEPTVAQEALLNDLTPVDVVVKRSRFSVLGGNAAKLLHHLQGLLNTTGFTRISQTAAAKATGIPIGSMSAAIKRLVELQRIEINFLGQLKLIPD